MTPGKRSSAVVLTHAQSSHFSTCFEAKNKVVLKLQAGESQVKRATCSFEAVVGRVQQLHVEGPLSRAELRGFLNSGRFRI